MRVRTSHALGLAVAIGGFTMYPPTGDAADVARWALGETGEWTVNTNNWQGVTEASLPSPGYPGTNHSVGISVGSVSISSQDLSIAELYMNDEAFLTITNGRMFTVKDSVNYRAADRLVGFVNVPDGILNLQNSETGIVCGLSFDLGTNNTRGYLDLGSTWGATSGFGEDFGILDTVLICLQNGGLRVDASNISMRNNSAILNHGQEVTFRGDWLNPDGTTTFIVNGNGPGTIDIGGNFSFGGCRLDANVDTDGVSLIQVGGDAILTNAVLTVGCSDALTSLAATYDLIRVPAARTIYTNGMAQCVASNGGFLYTAAIDADRGGYDYLVIIPGPFLPSVTITNPADESFFAAVTDLVITATGSARSGSITNVAFYADTNKVGEVGDAPYTIVWTNVYAGYYELKAVATDDNGNQGESLVVGVNVQGAAANGREVFITGGAVINYDAGCAQ